MAHNITIRAAERRDCALILQFIKDLAEYEHMLDQVSATEQSNTPGRAGGLIL
jgi:N-acetylglutamate synthase-like GNAT family acetyltransferase